MSIKNQLKTVFVIPLGDERSALRETIAQCNIPRIRVTAVLTIAIVLLLLSRAVWSGIRVATASHPLHYIILYFSMIAIMGASFFATYQYRKNPAQGAGWAVWASAAGSLLVLTWGAAVSVLDMHSGGVQAMVYIALQYLIVFMFLLPPRVSLLVLLFVQVIFTAGLTMAIGSRAGGYTNTILYTWINTLLAWLVSRAQYASAYRQFKTQSTIEAKNKLLEMLNIELEELSITDPLTSLMNRRSFDLIAMQEWHRAQRDGLPITVAIADVDHFKQYNDVYGHQMGDSCLRLVADSLRKNLRRASDIIARYGGEEFIIMLVGDEPWQARAVLDRACNAVESLGIAHAKSEASPYVTISMGAFCGIPTPGTSFEDMLRKADDGLYVAKNSGRNRFTWQDDNHQRPPLALVAVD